MFISELFIHRPVATVLLSVGLLLVGAAAYSSALWQACPICRPSRPRTLLGDRRTENAQPEACGRVDI